VREVAAYLMDLDHFAGVPETYLISNIRHPRLSTDAAKSGSLQCYISNTGESSSYGSSVWSVENIHRIGILDIRLFNLDRNGENMLVQKREDGMHLIPIDHAFCLPPVTSLDNAYFEWQYWPQAKIPFSQQTKEYIMAIDTNRDTQILQSLGIPEQSILTMIVASLLLKEAAGGEWTLFDIACFVARSNPFSTPSQFEELIAFSNSTSSQSGRPFVEVYQEALRDLVLKTCRKNNN